MSLDLVRMRLLQPIDWGVFESLVCEVLLNDDLPALRKLGGVADDGAYAVQESFFDSETIETTVVQVTSEVSQSAKFNRTVDRLKETKTEFDRLVVVFRQPVESKVRKLIQASAKQAGFTVDIRDESYLVAQLAKHKTVFQRYFGTTGDQLKALLDEGDPLELASEDTQRAVLASIGTYVCSPARQFV